MSESEQQPTVTDQDDSQPREDRATVGEDAGSGPEVLGAPEPETAGQRDPEQWVTGDQPATGPQKSYLDSLARQAGEEISADLTKAEASEHIDRLQQKLGVEGS